MWIVWYMWSVCFRWKKKMVTGEHSAKATDSWKYGQIWRKLTSMEQIWRKLAQKTARTRRNQLVEYRNHFFFLTTANSLMMMVIELIFNFSLMVDQNLCFLRQKLTVIRPCLFSIHEARDSCSFERVNSL